MNKLKLLIKASRPVFWFVPPLIFFVALTLSKAELNLLAWFQLLFLSFPYCLFLFGINDVYDYKSDMLNARKKGIMGAKLKPKYHSFVKKISIAAVIPLILSALATLDIGNILGTLLLMFLSYAYSVPPLRLKEKPPLDSLSNGLAILAAAFMGFSFGNSILQLPVKAYFVVACGVVTHSLFSIQDYSADKKAGHKTFITAFGKRTAAVLATLVFALTLLFGNFKIAAIDYYLILCIISSLAISIYPSEKLATSMIKIILIGFAITAVFVTTALAPISKFL